MKKVICILLIALLVIAGSVYSVGYSRRLPKRILKDQMSRRSENIHAALLRERDGPSPLELLSVEWDITSINRIDQGLELIHSWFSHIQGRMNEYAKQ